MSKIGKKNIIVPKDASIKIEGSNLTISGPKGTKKLTINDKIFSSKLIESEFQILPLEKKVDKKKHSRVPRDSIAIIKKLNIKKIIKINNL